jgi:hypothetical protein
MTLVQKGRNFFGGRGYAMADAEGYPMNMPRLKAAEFGVRNSDPLGPASLTNLVSNIKNTLGITPQDDRWALAVDQGLRHLDYNDLRAQYEDKAMQIDLNTMFKAVDSNNANSFLYKVICPPKSVSQMNFQGSDIEFYMAPFDRMNPLNIARVTGYKRHAYSTTLDFYKRSIEAEGTLLSDPVEGPKALNRMRSALIAQFELTFMVVIITAAVEVPYDREMKRLYNPFMPIHHARQELVDKGNVYIGAEDPLIWITRIKASLGDKSRARHLIIPTGAGTDLPLIKTEETIKSWREEYDTISKGFKLVPWDTGVIPLGNLPLGGGQTLYVHELSPFKGYSDDPEDLLNQPLRAHLTQGEHMMSPIPNLDDLINSPGTPSTSKVLDFLALEQTPTAIQWKRVHFEKYLAANVLFLGPDGRPQDGVDDGLSPIYTDGLKDAYNSDTNKPSFKAAFRQAQHADNDNAASVYLEQRTQLENMTGFRHFDGFMTYDDASGEVVAPQLVGDIEPKTLPTDYTMKMARVLVNEIRRRLPSSKYADVAKAGNLNLAIARFFLDAFPTCKYGKVDIEGFDDDAALSDFISYTMRTPDEGGSYGGRGAPERRAFQFFDGSPFDIRSKIKATGLLAPLPNETVDAYVARLSAPTLHAAVASKTIGDSAWVHLLQHTPDAVVEKLMALAYHAQKADAEAFTDDQVRAFANFGKDIVSSERGHARISEILDTVVKHVDAHPAKSVLVVMGEHPGAWLKRGVESRAAEKPRQSVTLADTVRDHLAGGSGTGGVRASKIGSFANAFASAKGRGALEDQIALAANPIWQNHEKQLLLSASEDPIVRLVYVLLISCKFNYFTCRVLAGFGLSLFRQAYVRPFIYQASDAAVLTPAGLDTWFCAYRLPQVVAGVNAAEHSWSAHAQMHMGVVCQSGSQDMKLFPWYFPREHFSGRTLEPIRHMSDADASLARDRRSILVLPVPVTETRHEDRLALTRQAMYGAPDQRSVMPTNKASFTDALRHFLGHDRLGFYQLAAGNLSQFYRPGTPMALQSYFPSLSRCRHIARRKVSCRYRATVYYPNSSDPAVRTWGLEPGAGPINSPPGRCDETSAEAFMGMRTFSKTIPITRTL